MHHTAHPSTAYSAAISRAPLAHANSFIHSSAVATASSPSTFTHTHHGRGMATGALASDIKEKSYPHLPDHCIAPRTARRKKSRAESADAAPRQSLVHTLRLPPPRSLPPPAPAA